jgi:hypothetical protein
VSPEDREAHMRRMLEHGEKVQEKFRQDNEDFERGCRAFWDRLRAIPITGPRRG